MQSLWPPNQQNWCVPFLYPVVILLQGPNKFLGMDAIIELYFGATEDPSNITFLTKRQVKLSHGGFSGFPLLPEHRGEETPESHTPSTMEGTHEETTPESSTASTP